MVVMVETQASGQSPAIPLQETPSDTPGLDATVILAEAMGRTLNALQMRKRNFDALDCSVPGVGLWKAAGLTKRLWEAYRDNPEEVTAKAQAAYTRILSS